jgi:hypothetical protein
LKVQYDETLSTVALKFNLRRCSVGFTSMLIVTSTILQMKRQVRALAEMPRLDKLLKRL